MRDRRAIDAVISGTRDTFRGRWQAQQRYLQEEITRVSSDLAVRGLGRSGALIEEHRRVYERGLQSADSMLKTAFSEFLSGIRPKPLTRLHLEARSLFETELRAIAAGFDRQLGDVERSTGLTLPIGPSTAVGLEALLAGLDGSIHGAIGTYEADRRKELPWIQRPIGIVTAILLTAAASAIATVMAEQFCGRPTDGHQRAATDSDVHRRLPTQSSGTNKKAVK